MSDDAFNGDVFDVDGWMSRIGHDGPREPSLPTLRAVIAAHTSTIPFENIDVLLGRPPKLDLRSLQRKLIASGRGGYCFEQNSLLLAGLLALGFRVTALLARVIRGMPADASGPQTHMMMQVDLPEGPFLADVGFGNQTPTAPLAMRPGIEQETPHETMRLWPVGDELTLQAKLGDDWQNIYRLSPHPRLTIDYEVANWFTATHPASPFVNNLIVARPGPDRSAAYSVQWPSYSSPARKTDGAIEARRRGGVPAALENRFGLTLSDADLTEALEVLERKGTRGATHPFFTLNPLNLVGSRSLPSRLPMWCVAAGKGGIRHDANFAVRAPRRANRSGQARDRMRRPPTHLAANSTSGSDGSPGRCTGWA